MNVTWPSLFVTGGAGLIGTVVAANWPGRCTSFDLPEGDARDREQLTAAVRGHDALLHLAWDTRAENFHNSGFEPDNLVMAVNAVEAALAAGVRRVVLASSVHADISSLSPRAGRTSADRVPVPDSPYGASKLFVEAFGRYAAAHRGLEVVAIRFGGVNRMDRRPDDEFERAVWLPQAACLSLIRAAVIAPLPESRFALVAGIGHGSKDVHAVGNDTDRLR